MRASFRGDLWLRLALTLTLWAAVVSSPIRRPSTANAPPNYLQRSFATCRVQRVRYVSQFDRSSGIGLYAGLAKGGSKPELPRAKPMSFSTPPLDPPLPSSRQHPPSTPLMVPLRC
jgi:hypothetical protein